MDTTIREYVKAGLTEAIRELEAQVDALKDSIESEQYSLYTKDQLLDRIANYRKAIRKAKELKELLNSSTIWSDKQEIGRITRLIFQIRYFVEEDAEHILADMAKGQITTDYTADTLH